MIIRGKIVDGRVLAVKKIIHQTTDNTAQTSDPTFTPIGPATVELGNW